MKCVLRHAMNTPAANEDGLCPNEDTLRVNEDAAANEDAPAEQMNTCFACMKTHSGE